MSIDDIKTVCMAILRLNDGKRFVEGADAPLPQSENEIGFRIQSERNKHGKFVLRYEEVVQVQKHFEPLYTNRLQLAGVKIEQ